MELADNLYHFHSGLSHLILDYNLRCGAPFESRSRADSRFPRLTDAVAPGGVNPSGRVKRHVTVRAVHPSSGAGGPSRRATYQAFSPTYKSLLPDFITPAGGRTSWRGSERKGPRGQTGPEWRETHRLVRQGAAGAECAGDNGLQRVEFYSPRATMARKQSEKRDCGRRDETGRKTVGGETGRDTVGGETGRETVGGETGRESVGGETDESLWTERRDESLWAERRTRVCGRRDGTRDCGRRDGRESVGGETGRETVGGETDESLWTESRDERLWAERRTRVCGRRDGTRDCGRRDGRESVDGETGRETVGEETDESLWAERRTRVCEQGETGRETVGGETGRDTVGGETGQARRYLPRALC
ncbi:hypothetical protein P4O66_002425 [Electrophorus voltai]|uniref:Uncharacterized protein n=1 Tax=Electrophorus voltai TaxID=2609070 RepID=A0AAD9DNU0_9TELE|nr:hypothetical protein P4O66_002425 [Electrophorus voltai]